MIGWHHWLNGHEFEQASGVGDEQGSLACCSPWGRKQLDTTERLNWTDAIQVICWQEAGLWETVDFLFQCERKEKKNLAVLRSLYSATKNYVFLQHIPGLLTVSGLSPLQEAVAWGVRHSMEKCEHLAFSPDIFTVRLGEGRAFSEMTTEKFLALNITLFKEGNNQLRLIKYSLKNTIFFYKLLKNSLLTSEQRESGICLHKHSTALQTQVLVLALLGEALNPSALSLCIWWLVIITRLPFPS